MASKREVFTFKRCHDEILLAEISNVEPYKFKTGTKERGSAWREVSDNLNNIKELGFKTTNRSVRDRFEKLLADFDKKENEERKASGVEVEYTDIHKALQDIKERIAEVKEEQEKEKDKANKEKVTAEQMRRKAMESLSETRKRSLGESSKDSDSDDCDDDVVKVTPKRKRSQGMAEILQDAMGSKKQSNEIRQRELELKAEEMKQNHVSSKYSDTATTISATTTSNE